jgi:hypothetical protein
VKQLLGITLVIFLLSAGLTAAQKDIDMAVYPTQIVVEPGEPAKFIVTAYSPENEGGLYLFVSGKPTQWINMGTSYIDLPIADPIDVLVEFYPNDVPGTYEYEMVLQSFSYPGLKKTAPVKLVVLGAEEVGGIDNEITVGEDSIGIRLALETDVEDAVTIDFSLLSSSGKTVSTYTRTFVFGGKKNITHQIPLTDAPFSGEYTVKVDVKDSDIAFEKSFMIEPVHRVVKTEEANSGPLFEEYEIEVSNEGNAIEEDYRVSADVPTGFVVYSRQPDSCEEGECEWVIPKLNPEEAFQIVYRVQHWPLIAEGVLIAVLLGVFVLFGWNRLNVPSFKKKLEIGKDGSYTTVLEIRNAGKKITNVVVKDDVSPLFRVKDEFETVKPAVKHHEDMTELVWLLPAIEPGDHRIIHYRMTPVVKGHLKVPRAYMRYAIKGGKKAKVSTKEMHVAA